MKQLGPEYNDLLGEYVYLSICHQKTRAVDFQLIILHSCPCAHAFRYLIFTFWISNQLLFLPSHKTWKSQISDADAGSVNQTYHDLSMRQNGCSTLVRMPTKECHTTKNTNMSLEWNNFSIDMEEESSDMQKVSNTITFAVVSCHNAHPQHSNKLVLGYTS